MRKDAMLHVRRQQFYASLPCGRRRPKDLTHLSATWDLQRSNAHIQAMERCVLPHQCVSGTWMHTLQMRNSAFVPYGSLLLLSCSQLLAKSCCTAHWFFIAAGIRCFWSICVTSNNTDSTARIRHSRATTAMEVFSCISFLVSPSADHLPP